MEEHPAGAERAVQDDDRKREATAVRRLNPLAALTLVLVFPHRTFERLRERPHWVLPVLFVMAAVLAKSLLALESGVLDRVLENEAFLTGVDIAEVRAGAPVAFAASALIGIPVILLLQALFYKVAGALFGGRARFATALSAVAYASVPIGVGALAAAALIPVTHSADLGADLSRFIDPTVHPFLWGLARELGVIPLWFYALIVAAAGPVFRLPRRRAWAAAGVFMAVHIVIMSYLGIGQAKSQVDPHEGWGRVELAGVAVHLPEDASETLEAEAVSSATAGAERVAAIVGGLDERIDCYVYPSLGEKERVTGNAAIAHGVTWANAVHVAWQGRPEVALTREMAQVASARALGKMYNPFIRNGLAVCAGEEWSGMPVVDVARELRAAGSLPRLEDLVDPSIHARLDARVSDPAAGAFTSFLLEELGEPAYRDFYSHVARAGGRVVDALERALGDSLGAVEARWISFLETGDGGAPDGETH